MPWSRDYLRELLQSDKPIQALGELADIWSSRAGRKVTDPYIGLLPCQYHAHLFLNYQGEVGNGGHSQFFMNSTGAFANETIVSLEELGFQEFKDILRRAVSVYPNSQVPKDWEERNLLIEKFPENAFSFWDQLDRELNSLDYTFLSLLLEYLRKHELEILDRDGS